MKANPREASPSPRPTNQKRQSDASEPRFLNFPVCLLKETLVEYPVQGLAYISVYALNSIANSYEMTWQDALGRLAFRLNKESSKFSGQVDSPVAYWLEHEPKPPLSTDVLKLCQNPKIQMLGEMAKSMHLRSPTDSRRPNQEEYSYQTRILWHTEDYGITLTDNQKSNLVAWAKMEMAAEFLQAPLALAGYDLHIGRFPTVRNIIEEHAKMFKTKKADALASVPADFFLETIRATDKEDKDSKESIDRMRLFRMVCAVRSIVGKSPYRQATKLAIASRCVGAKTPEIAELMAAHNRRVKEELHALRAAGKTFGTILRRGERTPDHGGFFTTFGSRELRRVYLSIEAPTKEKLESRVVRDRT